MELPSFKEIPLQNDLLNGGEPVVLDERAPYPHCHVLHHIHTDAHDGNHHQIRETLPHGIWRLRRNIQK